MIYKILFSIVFIVLIFGCGDDTSFTCKDYAGENNYTYIDDNLSPILKNTDYLLIKGVASIEPVTELADIKFQLTSIVLPNSFECVKITQDVNDTNFAQIIFK